MKAKSRSFLLAGTVLLAAGCGPDEPTHTGYVGTWSRGGEVRSTLAIVRDGESYRVRWTLTSTAANSQRSVRCDWDGLCEETIDGDKTAEFKLTPSVHPETGNLRIDCVGKVLKPTPGEFHYLDELVVRTRGLKLVAHTLEQQGQHYTRGEGQPKRIFEKVSDEVTDPPPTRG